MRRLTIDTRDGGTRDLVLRTFVNVEHAEDWLHREAGALTLLAGTGVPAPGLVAVDPTAAHCEYPSLLKTHLAGRRGVCGSLRRMRRRAGCRPRPRASAVLAGAGRARVLGRSAVGGAVMAGAGRAELTTRAVEERLDAYVTALMDARG